LAFFKPRGERLTVDAEDTADTTHGAALLISGQYSLTQLLPMSGAAGVLPEGASAVSAAEALHILIVFAVTDDVLAVTMAAMDDLNNHGLSLTQQPKLCHYPKGDG
jgi:hypothetical protein